MNTKHFQKEFIYDADCFYYECFPSDQRLFYIWHKCSNRLISFKLNNANSGEGTFSYRYGSEKRDFSELGLICPNCGQPLTHGVKMSGDKYSNLSFTIKRFVGIDVNGFKISIGIVNVTYTLWPTQKEENAYFIVESYSTRLCLNVETGFSYEFNTIKLMNRGGLNPNSKRGVKNISYVGSRIDLPDDALSHLSYVVNEKMAIPLSQNQGSMWRRKS